jgi:hypothetical protein
MAVEIYKVPPAFCFSGNPIVIGVKDTGLLTNNTEQHCIFSFVWSVGPTTDYAIKITYNGVHYYFQNTESARWPLTLYKAILSLKSGGETLAQWVERIALILRTDTELNAVLYIEYSGTEIVLIERSPAGDIVGLVDVCYIDSDGSGYFTGSTIQASSQINLGEPHYIGIMPEKALTVNLALTGGTIATLPEYYGDAIEVASDIYFEDETDPLAKTTDRSMFKDIDVAPLVKYEQRGHFSLTALYTVRDLAQQFSFYCYAVKGVPPVRSSGVRTAIIYIIEAEITRTQQANLNALSKSLWQHLVDTKIFMTWAPNNKLVDVYAPELLYFPIKVNATGIQYFVKEYYSDNTNATALVATFNASQYQVVELSAAFLDIQQDSGKTVIKYDLWLADSDDVAISEVRTYIMDYKFYPFARWWFFKNGFGVYECMRTTGKAEKSVDIQKEFIEIELPSDYTDTDRSRKQVSNNNQYKIKCSSGALSKLWAQYYLELFDSEDVYLLSKGKAIPATIEPNEYVYESDGINISPHTFEAIMESLDEEHPDTSIILPVDGDFNGDFNESFLIGS